MFGSDVRPAGDYYYKLAFHRCSLKYFRKTCVIADKSWCGYAVKVEPFDMVAADKIFVLNAMWERVYFCVFGNNLSLSVAGYGVVAGAKYKLAEKVYANGGLEYNRLGSFDDTKVNNYGAKVGVGYEF